jgi:hypothetical protein
VDDAQIVMSHYYLWVFTGLCITRWEPSLPKC